MNIVKHIPNTITSMNLLCGALGVIFTFQARFDLAFILMLAAAVCDFFDGFAARLLKAYSPMGKELDSLADMVSFGLAPATIMFNKMLEYFKLDFQEGADRLASLFNLELATSSDIFSKIQIHIFLQVQGLQSSQGGT